MPDLASCVRQVLAKLAAHPHTQSDSSAIVLSWLQSQYTGVYARGGPTNVDMDPKNLAGLCDR